MNERAALDCTMYVVEQGLKSTVTHLIEQHDLTQIEAELVIVAVLKNILSAAQNRIN